METTSTYIVSVESKSLKPLVQRAGVSALESHLGYWLRFVSNQVSQAFAEKLKAPELAKYAPWLRDARLFRFAPVSEEMVLNFIAIHDLGMPRGY